MKKLITILTIMTLALAFIVGCDNDVTEPDSTAGVRLGEWSGPDGDAGRVSVEPFGFVQLANAVNYDLGTVETVRPTRIPADKSQPIGAVGEVMGASAYEITLTPENATLYGIHQVELPLDGRDELVVEFGFVSDGMFERLAGDDGVLDIELPLREIRYWTGMGRMGELISVEAADVGGYLYAEDLDLRSICGSRMLETAVNCVLPDGTTELAVIGIGLSVDGAAQADDYEPCPLLGSWFNDDCKKQKCKFTITVPPISWEVKGACYGAMICPCDGFITPANQAQAQGLLR